MFIYNKNQIVLNTLVLTECFVHPNSYVEAVKSCTVVFEDRAYKKVFRVKWGHMLENKMAAHSSILAWRIPWTEEPGELLSVRSHRVGHD